MLSLVNKRILLGVSGGIAAYKSAELVRLLKQAGAEVKVVMTEAAQQFIGPLTLQALSGEGVHTDLLDPEAEAGMGHIELARWADLILVAPATAETLAKLATGRADDLLSTLCLAARAPLAVAPAMNQAMWHHSATQDNLQLLSQRNVQVWGPEAGEQACGDVGEGRMMAPQSLLSHVEACFQHESLSGKKVVITAGPTREALDPVRYLSNHSSGKMGYALAQAAIEAGAQTYLISGPVAMTAPERATYCAVESAQDMLDAALAALEGCDIFIAAAAVADYRPVEPSTQKIKKQHDVLHLELVKNPDILATVARADNRPSLVVGFAAETQNLLDNAQKKLVGKGLDMIVANDVADERGVFNSDDNAVCVLSADGEPTHFERQSKHQLARQLIRMFSSDSTQ